MKNKILIKIVLITILAMLIGMGNVKAVYQSTPYTHEHPQTQTWDTWLSEIRTMEKTGGAMGLDETLNGTAATSDSNNIDVHMMKATEYGAIALLSASPYGNLNNTQKPATSTGDTAAEGPTGVYYNYNNWEFTACIGAEDVGNTFSKYWDKYNTLSLRGMSPSQTWHGGSAGNSHDSSGVYDPVLGFQDQYGSVYVIYDSTPSKGGRKSALTIGANGIFSYNWVCKNTGYLKDGQRDYYYAPSNTNLAYVTGGYRPNKVATHVAPESFYARGAAVNMEGI